MARQSKLVQVSGTDATASKAGVSRAFETAYAALAWVFVLCVGYQVFLAGMAVFVDAINWVRHVSFVHYFELIPVVMLIVAFVGKMPKGQGLYLRPTLLFVLVGLQYALAGSGRGVLAALHPVNALLIFWLAVAVATSIRPIRNGSGKVLM